MSLSVDPPSSMRTRKLIARNHIVDDDRTAVYACFDLSNDPRSARPLGWTILCHVPSPKALAIPVCYNHLCSSCLISLTNLDLVGPYRWLSLVTVMIGVSVVGLSGSLAKDSGKGDASLQSLATRMIEGEEVPGEVTVFIGILFILFAQLL